MKVLFITNLYPPDSIGGYEEVCRDMAEGLRARGHDVCVLTSNYRAPFRQDHPRVLRGLRVQQDWLSVPSQLLPVRFIHSLRVDRYNTRVIRRVMSTELPQVVVYWHGGNLGRGPLWAAQAHPAVVWYLEDTWLGGILTEGQRRASLRKVVESLSLRLMGIRSRPLSVSHLIFCSQALHDEYQELGVDITNARVIPNGVSGELFTFGQQRIVNRPPGTPIKLLYTGRVKIEKGVITLVRALAKLRTLAEFRETVLTIMGAIQSQAFEMQLRREIGALGLDGAVHFVGHLPRNELPDVYKRHDVAVFPSEWREPFGLTLVEAMAAGLPVVSTVIGGPAEIVRNYLNAIAFRAGDADDLADKLAWVLGHPVEAAAMGLRASQDVRERFSTGAQLDGLEGYLLSMLPDGSSRRPPVEVAAAN